MSDESESPPEVDASFTAKNKDKHSHSDWKPVAKAESLKRKTFDDQLDLPADNWHLPEPVITETKDDSHVKLVFKDRKVTGLPSTSSSEATETIVYEKEKSASNESELPPEVDAFLQGKNKYKHPYGDWKPVVKAEPLKRQTFGDQLDLPADNWHLPENQPEPVITVTKDDYHVKLVFKEREVTELPAISSSKASEMAVFKKPKSASHRQLRGSSNKDGQKKGDVDES